MLATRVYLQNKLKMYVYVLRKVLSFLEPQDPKEGATLILSQTESHKSLNLMNADYSEPELLEEEVDSWLLLIVGIWGVVSTAILEL